MRNESAYAARAEYVDASWNICWLFSELYR
jgi:hypothetical protein